MTTFTRGLSPLEAQVREYFRWQSSPEIYRICTRIVRGRIKAARTAITVCALETCCGKGSAVGRLNVKESVSFLLAEQITNMALKRQPRIHPRKWPRGDG